jgi:hypothetical protein
MSNVFRRLSDEGGGRSRLARHDVGRTRFRNVVAADMEVVVGAGVFDDEEVEGKEAEEEEGKRGPCIEGGRYRGGASSCKDVTWLEDERCGVGVLRFGVEEDFDSSCPYPGYRGLWLPHKEVLPLLLPAVGVERVSKSEYIHGAYP